MTFGTTLVVYFNDTAPNKGVNIFNKVWKYAVFGSITLTPLIVLHY
jgi:hypothetical protein